MTDTLPVLDDLKLSALGTRLKGIWTTYVTDRKFLEERWLRNLLQVRKIYDPEVLALIPPDRSKAYPGVTQWMVRGTIARLMQMLFPQTEKNFGVKNSPLPDLSKEQLQQVLDALVKAKTPEGGDSAAVELTTIEIETAIIEFAKGKAERMELKITDDLAEMEFITLARRVVKSAVTYSLGILRGPVHKKVMARSWQKNVNTGAYEAIEVDKYKPFFEFLSIWDHYFDMTATALDKQDGCFDRHIMTRSEVEALADRPDFLKVRVLQYLATHTAGNYKPQWWESAIKGEPKSAKGSTANMEGRKFEALSYWGDISAHELAAAGVAIAEADLGKSFRANVWMLDDLVIKARLAPLGDKVRTHHYFVFEEDDLSIAGNGQPDVLRDSQSAICETARAALDNMSVIGPVLEVNVDLLTPGQDTRIAKHKVYHREGEGNAASLPAVRNINVDSHLVELKALLDLFMSFADKESGLPPPSLGDTSGGGSEALRTTKNASMFLGAAALPIRDTVRNYDTFTISFISALVAWNMKFDPNDSRDGDHDVIARGSTSLIAKEVLAGALNEFRASVTPDEVPHLKTRGMLIARMKANDLPLDDLLEDEVTAGENVAAQQEAASSQAQAALGLVNAQVEEALANAFKRAAEARKADSSIGTDVFEQLIAAMAAGAKARAQDSKVVADHVSAGARMVAAHKPSAGAAS
jgi:hypothetical protein